MAQHNLNHLITRINAAGGTTDQLTDLTDVAYVGGDLIAWNRRAEQAAYAAVDAAEAAASPATTPRAVAAPAATERQVAFIIRLIGAAQRHGDEGLGGFMHGPTTWDGISQLTRREASVYIDSLTGQY